MFCAEWQKKWTIHYDHTMLDDKKLLIFWVEGYPEKKLDLCKKLLVC